MLNHSKTFRLFISSTFSDFHEEREILQTKVFPKIKQYCSEHGYTFQPIDLRWGVSNEAQLDQSALNLCLSEVKSCKSYVHPNFLIMIGDRYGWIPLPNIIEKLEFESLLNEVATEDKKYLDDWYYEDRNQLPTSYILKERDTEFIDYEHWAIVENKLRLILQEVVSKSSLKEEKKSKYFTSATEAETIEGIIPYIHITDNQKKLLKDVPQLQTIDPNNIFAFFRNIDKSTQQGEKFISSDYRKSQIFKNDIKEVLPNKNILNTQTKQLNTEELDVEYMSKFESKVISFLEYQVDEQISKEQNNNISSLEKEKLQQQLFLTSKAKNFLGQDKILNEIKNYINNDILTFAPK